MTREEAIEQLKFIGENIPKEPPTECDYIKEWLDTDKDIKNALDMAIKALEQEPCEELFDDWHEAPSYAMTLEQAREAVHELRKEAVKLRKESCEDAVSREKVWYIITGGKYSDESCEQFIDRLVEELNDLPPVAPTADVVEREKIDKAIEEMKALADPENTILGFDEKMGLKTAMNILVRNIGE